MLAIVLMTQGCKTTPEYIYVQPECSVPARKTLSEVDSGILYSALTLPHSLHPKDLSELSPELLNGYDGDTMYWVLLDNQTLLVDMLIEREAVLGEICGK